MCLYPTFKEWKRIFWSNSDMFPVVVYILPLRNENLRTEGKNDLESSPVYILPLRNENVVHRNRWKNKDLVYILPLRNENRNQKSIPDLILQVFISYL